MATVSLSTFVDPIPSGLGTATPALWQRTCLGAEANAIVLVDGRGHPLGWLTLVHILVLLGGGKSAPGGSILPLSQEGGIDPRVATLMVPVGVLPLDTPPIQAAERVRGAVDRPWVVVDAQHRYGGCLNVARLLEYIRGGTIPSSPEEGGTGVTALLTYLGHELKTPLTSLLGLASLLQREAVGTLSDRQSHYVNLMQTQTRRLTAMVNGVLDLGRIESHSLHLMPQIVEVAPLCQEAYRQARLLIQGQKTDEPVAPWPEIVLVADALRLGQMLTYLFQVALKANPGEGEDCCPLQVQRWGPWAVFRPLGLAGVVSQLPVASMSLPQGLMAFQGEGGLDAGWLELVLTRQLAHLHGGDLVMVAAAGETLTPVLLLPAGAGELAAATDHLVVVATQDSDLATAIAQQLSPLGHHLLVTQPGPETLAVTARLTPKAVVVPLMEPLGETMLAQLKASPQTVGCITIALDPALGQMGSPNAAAAATADRCIPWPSEDLAPFLATPSLTPSRPLTRITVLALKAHDDSGSSTLTEDLSSLLHDGGCRVLEVDDLDQADLISRVWQPDVIVLDPNLHHPESYLQGLSQFPNLAALPVITLTPEATDWAYQVASLQVFPCLPGSCPWRSPQGHEQVTGWLVQVLRAVTNYPNQPSNANSG